MQMLRTKPTAKFLTQVSDDFGHARCEAALDCLEQSHQCALTGTVPLPLEKSARASRYVGNYQSRFVLHTVLVVQSDDVEDLLGFGEVLVEVLGIVHDDTRESL